MKTLKRKTKQRKVNRKNPHSDSYALNTIYGYLLTAVATGEAHNLSNLLSYLAVYQKGVYCEDCDQIYYECTCEGSRTIPGNPCEECKQNRCLCDYDIKNAKEVTLTAAQIAKKILNFIELKELKEKTINSIIWLSGSASPAPSNKVNSEFAKINRYKLFLMELEK